MMVMGKDLDVGLKEPLLGVGADACHASAASLSGPAAGWCLRSMSGLTWSGVLHREPHQRLTRRTYNHLFRRYHLRVAPYTHITTHLMTQPPRMLAAVPG